MEKLQHYIENITADSGFNLATTDDFINKIDIIVPVFNGFEALRPCIDALLAHTDHTHTICILNDASTDPSVAPYLDQMAADNQHISVIHRTRNLGYLENVNQYLSRLNGDVLLLNSDTKVTAGWLAEMSCIAADKRVGAVCPLSNNATILTLDTINQESLDGLADFASHWFPVPTAVGFCLLLKQQVLEALGGFDPYYDPGYGEECDYSMLIREMGLQIACAPAAFVHHQGSVSFQRKAAKLQSQHQKLLDLRWPDFQHEVASFVPYNPVKIIEQHLLAKHQAKPRILHVVHGIDNKGGVELFTQQLLSKLNDDFVHCLLIPQRPKKQKNKCAFESKFSLIELEQGNSKPKHIIFNIPADLNNKSLDSYFKKFIQHGQFKLLHFHSLVGVGTAVWPLICHQLGIPYFFFLHDHSGLCQIFSLSTTVNNQEIYCGKQRLEVNSSQCLQCIQQKTKKTQLTTASYLANREEIWQRIINNASRIYFPSDYLQAIYQQSHKDIKTKSSVFAPCFNPSSSIQTKPFDPETVNIAFLGQFGILKGAQLFIDLYHQMNAEHLNWQIIGGTDPKYNKQLENTQIKVTGSYESEQLASLLKGVDLIVFTTQIPETYGITLTEAWNHGIPAVAPDLGAYSVRIKDQVNGLLYEPNNIKSLVSTIQSFITKQSSKRMIDQIDYVAQHEQDLTALQQDYQQHALNKPLHRGIQNSQVLLEKPKSNAYRNMQYWLASPATLEAQADWKNAPADFCVCIKGDNEYSLQLTQKSIQSQLEEPQLITADQLYSKAQTSITLLIEAGNQINENIGNWIAHFKAQGAALGLADFALRNQQQQSYAPQFEGRFSWSNYLATNQQVGCILINHKHWPINQWQKLLATKAPLNHWVHAAENLPGQHITYFPYLSYWMPDLLWVKNWKYQQNTQASSNHKNKTQQLLILMETNLHGVERENLSNRVAAQSLVIEGLATVKYCATKNKQKVLHELDTEAYTHWLMLADNIHFKHHDSLQNMLLDFENSHLDAVSIPAARDLNEHYLVAKKMGAAPYFHGIGRIRDMRFMRPNTAIEHDLLDDDFMFFKPTAWTTEVAQIIANSGHYQSLKVSICLQQAGQAVGIIEAKGIYKLGLPSQDLSGPVMRLSEQRHEIIESGYHLIKQSTYPKALSCRRGCDLDLEMASFKTPKTLPRVIAYAQDDWASGFYRVKSPLTALAAANHISIHFLSASSTQRIPTPIEIDRLEPDVLLFHGFYLDKQLAAMHQYRKQLDIPMIISIDDLLTDIPNYNPFSSKTPSDIKTRIKLACSLADTLVVSTENLADQFSPLHQNIQVIPNRISKQIWPPLTKSRTANKKLRIGWAGAGQHQADLAWLKPVVEATQNQFDWVFFGDQPQGLNTNTIEFHQPVDLIHYPEYLKRLNLDLAVAPLVNNPFNQAKSQLKLVEFGALGIPVIASDLACYQNSPAMLLANKPSLWINALLSIDQDRQALVKAGTTLQEWVTEHYYLEDHLNQWLGVLLPSQLQSKPGL